MVKKAYEKKAAYFEMKNQMIPNALVFHRQMSSNAKLFLMALNAIATCAPSWIVHQEDLQERLGWGRDKMRNAVKECIELGYLRVSQNRDEKGNFVRNKFDFNLDGCYLEKKPSTANAFPEKHPLPNLKKEPCIKKIIIAPPSPKPTAAAGNKKSSNAKKEILKPKKFEVERPVAPKPQMHACLATCHDLSDAQKIQLSRASVELVEAAVRYSYHPTTKQYEGNAGRMRQLQHFIKNPELFTETMQNLGKPRSPKEKILSRFKHGETYNGYEFCHDDKAMWFVVPSAQSLEAYTLKWKAEGFENRLKEMFKKLGIKYEI